MQSLTRNVERRLIETPLPPTLAVFLAGMLALITTFALPCWPPAGGIASAPSALG